MVTRTPTLNAGRSRPSRMLSTREVALLSPTVLVAEQDSSAVMFPSAVGRRDWPTAEYTDVTRAAQHASVRETRLVVVGGDTFPWVLRAVTEVRPAGDFPIAVIGGPWTSEQVIALLEAGATMTIDQASSTRETMLRLAALCRGYRGDGAIQVRWMQAGELRVDVGARRVHLGAERVKLSQNEFDLLAFLMSRAEQAVPAQEIIEQVWGWKHGDGLNTLRIHIGRLRRKLHDSTASSLWIGSNRGLGYQFLQPVAEVGGDRSEDRLRRSVATLNAQSDAMYAIVDGLFASRHVVEASETVVHWAVGRNFCDAATVFRLDVDPDGVEMSRLVASAGMSSRWRQALATGHPVQEGFMGAHAYASGSAVQVSDVSRFGRRFPVTASMSSAEDLHASVLFPLFVNGRIWGDLAFVSRTARAFTPGRAAYLRSIAGIMSLALAGLDGRPDVDDVGWGDTDE